jgi:hypothetical protein
MASHIERPFPKLRMLPPPFSADIISCEAAAIAAWVVSRKAPSARCESVKVFTT